jgi:hypothetical protein
MQESKNIRIEKMHLHDLKLQEFLNTCLWIVHMYQTHEFYMIEGDSRDIQSVSAKTTYIMERVI